MWPVDQGWNDFGFGFRAKARLRPASEVGQVLQVELLVIPKPDELQAQRFDRWLSALEPQGAVHRAANLGSRFVSILRSERNYKDLVRWAAASEVEIADVLLPLRDVVYFRAHLLKSEELAAFLLTEPATNGVFRNEQTYLAWHRAARTIAVGNAPVEVEDAKNDFSFQTTLPGFSGPHSIRISYGVPSPLSDRCHALIGRNGVGKSQLLRELIIELGRRLDGTEVDPFTSGALPRGMDTTLSPEGFRVNRVLALSWDSRSPFPPQARLNSRLQYLYFDMRDEEQENGDSASIAASDTLASQLVQLLREQLGQLGEGLNRLRSTLRPLFDSEDLAVAVRRNDGAGGPRWLSLRHLRGAGEGRQLEYFGNLEAGCAPRRMTDDGTIVELSSGERAFLAFGIRCAARVETGTLLILDEPETHLHPTLVSDFMRVLNSLLEATRSIAIVATHSPFVVRELPGRCVHVLRTDSERTPEISSAFLRTFGASVDALAADIFEDAESPQVNRDVAKRIAESGLSGEEIRARYGREVSMDLLSEIRQLMRDANR